MLVAPSSKSQAQEASARPFVVEVSVKAIGVPCTTLVALALKSAVRVGVRTMARWRADSARHALGAGDDGVIGVDEGAGRAGQHAAEPTHAPHRLASVANVHCTELFTRVPSLAV